MARKRKQDSNLVGLVILGVIGFGIYQFGIVGNLDRSTAATARPAAVTSPPAKPAAKPAPTSVPLSAPRYVNVAALNVRHTPSTSGPLIMTLPQGTQLQVLGREKGWLLIDINPTLEGWVSEELTTTEAPAKTLVPPGNVKALR